MSTGQDRIVGRGGESRAVIRIRLSDHRIEEAVDLKNMVVAGRMDSALALAPDDSPLLLRDNGSQDVYSVDWEVP